MHAHDFVFIFISNFSRFLKIPLPVFCWFSASVNVNASLIPRSLVLYTYVREEGLVNVVHNSTRGYIDHN